MEQTLDRKKTVIKVISARTGDLQIACKQSALQTKRDYLKNLVNMWQSNFALCDAINVYPIYTWP